MTLHQIQLPKSNQKSHDASSVLREKGITLNENMVCRLNKGIYGLKQAGRIWYQAMSKLFLRLGFKQSKADSCLFQLIDGDSRIIITSWVDDCIVAYNNEKMWKKVLKQITNKFKLGYGEDFSWCLGMAVQRDLETGTLRLHQSLYVQDLLAKFNMADAAPISTPADHHTVLTLDMGESSRGASFCSAATKSVWEIVR